jgi:hypothetical protein
MGRFTGRFSKHYCGLDLAICASIFPPIDPMPSKSFAPRPRGLLLGKLGIHKRLGEATTLLNDVELGKVVASGPTLAASARHGADTGMARMMALQSKGHENALRAGRTVKADR